jgi:type IV secretion system protein VirD4
MNEQAILPPDPGYLGRVRPYSHIVAITVFLICQFAITQWVASQFMLVNEWPAKPLFVLAGYAIFKPWGWVVWFWAFRPYLFHTVEPYSHAMRWSLMNLVGSFLLSNFAQIVALQLFTRYNSSGNKHLYDSARWAEKADLQECGFLNADNYGGFNLGLWAEPGSSNAVYLRDRSDVHALLCAATRTGKTQSVITMTATEWAGSMIVLDIKGELWDNTSGWRHKLGHRCLRFDPTNPETSVRFNPLSLVRLETRREVSDAQNLAEIIGRPGREGDSASHWNDTSCSLIAGVLLHEMYRIKQQYKRPGTLRDVSMGLSPFKMTFTKYLQTMAQYQHDPKLLRGWRDEDGQPTPTHPFVREKALEALYRTGDEASGVLSTAKKRFAAFSDPSIATVTSANDFTIDDFQHATQPISLYVVIPPSDKKRLSPLLRIMIGAFMTRLLEKQQAYKHELLFLLDEFPALRYLEPLEDALSTCGSYGIRCMLAVQAFEQIYKHYGQQEEIIQNCALQIIFAVAKARTAEEISNTLGNITIQHASYNFSMHGKLNGEGTTGHVQNTKRPLMTPHELMSLSLPKKVGRRVVSPGQYVLLAFGYRPVRGLQAFWFFDPVVKERIGIKPPTRFTTGSLRELMNA